MSGALIVVHRPFASGGRRVTAHGGGPGEVLGTAYRDLVVFLEGAGLTTPRHNDRTEGVDTRAKRIMRQMYGRAGFPLFRHRLLR